MRLRNLVTLALTACALAACSLFVGLDDLQGGATPGDAALADASNDASNADAVVDSGSDATAQDAAADAALDIQFVQVAAFGFNDAGTGSLDIPRVQPGDTLIVALDVDIATSTVTVTDDQGDTFAVVVGPYDDGVVGDRAITFAAIGVPAPGPTQITIAIDPATSVEVYIHEYSGITAFDVGIVGASSSTATDGLASGFVTTAVANELLFAYAGSSEAATAGTGFTPRSSFNDNVSEDRIAGPPGAYQATATLSSGASGNIMLSCFR